MIYSKNHVGKIYDHECKSKDIIYLRWNDCYFCIICHDIFTKKYSSSDIIESVI